jgi:hypothetical protein
MRDKTLACLKIDFQGQVTLPAALKTCIFMGQLETPAAFENAFAYAVGRTISHRKQFYFSF